MPLPERGEIHQIDVPRSEVLGHELYGPHLWAILSVTPLNKAHCVFTAVPFTSIMNETGLPKDAGNRRHFRIRVVQASKIPDPGQRADIFNGDSIALTEQTRVFSDQSIQGPRVGRLDHTGLGAIEAGLLFVTIVEDLTVS